MEAKQSRGTRSPFSWVRVGNWLKNAFSNPYNLLVIISVVALALLVVWPLLQMVVTTFQLAPAEARRTHGTAGEWTLYYWQRILNSTVSSNMLYRPLLNSLMIALCVSVGSILLGGIIAWLMVRSDLPCKKFFSLAVIIPYMIPSWCKSMAWISVFKTPRIGGSAGFLSFLGVAVPEWLAYGPVAIICVLIIHYYAYAYQWLPIEPAWLCNAVHLTLLSLTGTLLGCLAFGAVGSRLRLVPWAYSFFPVYVLACALVAWLGLEGETRTLALQLVCLYTLAPAIIGMAVSWPFYFWLRRRKSVKR